MRAAEPAVPPSKEAALTTGLAKGVEVTAVRFTITSTTPTGGGGLWLETDVEVNVKPGVAKDDRYLNRVQVTLTLGVESTVGGKRTDYYRATAEAVALEEGRSDFRFYLPPEIVKRDSLPAEARYYAVQITAEGNQLPVGKNFHSGSIPKPETFFASKEVTAAAANDGVLLPQFLTPFANDDSRPAPTFIRPEAAAKN